MIDYFLERSREKIWHLNNTTWIELATRGANTFSGDQVVSGGISSISSGDLGGYFSLVNNSKTAAGTALRWSIYNMTGSYGNSLQFWAYDNFGLCRWFV